MEMNNNINQYVSYQARNKFLSLYQVSHGGHSTIVPLEGLRAIAAFMVFIVHYTAQFTPWIDQDSITWELIKYYRHLGSKGVELFFVISGFLIYGMLIRREEPFVQYMFRRIKRLYPTFIVMLLIYIVLSFLFPHESKFPNGIIETIQYITLNFLMIPGIYPIEPIITVAWSLSYEMFFYLSVPIIIWILNLRNWPAINRIILLLLASILGFSLVFFGYDSHSKILLFMSGMLLYEFHAMKGESKEIHTFNYCIIIIIIALVTIKILNLAYIYSLLVLFVGFFYLCMSSFDSRTTLSRFCSSTLLRCYGNMSYSYYLVHGITLKFFFLIFGYFFPANHQWEFIVYYLFIPVFIITWITSTVLFISVEKPFSLTKNQVKPEPIKVDN